MDTLLPTIVSIRQKTASSKLLWFRWKMAMQPGSTKSNARFGYGQMSCHVFLLKFLSWLETLFSSCPSFEVTSNTSRQFPRGSVSILVISAISNPYIEFGGSCGSCLRPSQWSSMVLASPFRHCPWKAKVDWDRWVQRGWRRYKVGKGNIHCLQNRSVLTCWIGIETRHLVIQSNQFMYTRVYMCIYVYVSL